MFGLKKADKIKQAYSIKQVVENYGVTLKPCGPGKYMGLCPFHDDHNPSLMVDENRQQFICFAGCGKGSVIDWEMLKHQISFKEALSRFEDPKKKLVPRSQERSEGEEGSKMPSLRILQDATDFYHRALLGNPVAQKYLRKRGIFNSELVERFKIGYCDGLLKKILHGSDITATKEVGILSDKNYETFTGYLVFPITDENGAVVNLYGRHIDPPPATLSHLNHSKMPTHRYIKGENRGVFNWQALKASKRIVLVESIIDALSVMQMGELHVVPLYGTNGLTRDHLALFEKYHTEEIVLMMDNDETGSNAVESITKRLTPLGITVSKIDLPSDCKDPNELLRKQGSESSIEQLLENRQCLSTPEKNLDLPPIIDHHAPSANGHLTFTHNNITYTARGLKSVTDTSMKVLLEAKQNGSSHTDRFDLYVSRSRKTFAGHVARTFNLQQAKIDDALTDLVKRIEQHRKDEKARNEKGTQAYVMTTKERSNAITYLKTPDLLNRINTLISRMGYVGEDNNRKLAFLVAISSKLDTPLSLLIRSNSSAGKSDLMEKVVALMPEEDVFFLSRISPQALYYMPEDGLRHKLMIIDEKHGAEEAEYSIRNLQSRKKLTMAVVMKDPSTGKGKTTIFEVKGPIAYMDSSTATRDNPENENRCFVVYLDETPEQTGRVIQAQNRSKMIQGKESTTLLDNEIQTAQNAIRSLVPIKITIPFLDKVTFPAEYLRARRDNMRFLNLIEAIAFLHQHQRPRKRHPELGEYIEATQEDYRTAYDLIRYTIGCTYSDIPRSARMILEGSREAVTKQAAEDGIQPMEYTFTRRQIRNWLKISQDQVKRALRTLVDLEYIKTVSGSNGSRYKYQLGDADQERSVIESVTSPEDLVR